MAAPLLQPLKATLTTTVSSAPTHPLSQLVVLPQLSSHLPPFSHQLPLNPNLPLPSNNVPPSNHLLHLFRPVSLNSDLRSTKRHPITRTRPSNPRLPSNSLRRLPLHPPPSATASSSTPRAAPNDRTRRASPSRAWAASGSPAAARSSTTSRASPTTRPPTSSRPPTTPTCGTSWKPPSSRRRASPPGRPCA